MYTMNLRGQELTVLLSRYRDNQRPAIIITDPTDNEEYCTASVNLPNEPMAPGEVAIKDYSENEGVLPALIEAGIVSEPVRRVKSGWVSIPVCRLLISEPSHD